MTGEEISKAVRDSLAAEVMGGRTFTAKEVKAYSVGFKNAIKLNQQKVNRQLENLLFEVYEEGVDNKDCDLTSYAKKINELK